MTTESTAPTQGTRPRGGFFDWIRGAGFFRGHGWFGGVSVAIANRVGIDAIVVRGLFVVLTVLGFPAILLYAILWLLLPDEEGVIQLQELLHGRLHPSLAGIGLTFLFALVPVSSMLWRAFNAIVDPYGAVSVYSVDGTYYEGYGSDVFGLTDGPDVSFAAILSIAVVGVIAIGTTILIVFIGRRRTAAAGNASSASVTAQAPTASFVAAPTTGEISTTQPSPELAEWRDNHEQTQRNVEAFLVDQQDDASAQKRAQKERERAWRKFSDQMAQQRAIQRASNPRTSLMYTVGAIGLALIVACVVALVRQSTSVSEAIALGSFAGAVVLAASMIIAGISRRRSGLLAFATVGALAIGSMGVMASRPSGLVWDGASVYGGNVPLVQQPYGVLSMYYTPTMADSTNSTTRVIKGEGTTYIYVDAGINLDFDASFSGSSRVILDVQNGDGLSNGHEVVPPKKSGEDEMYSIEIDTHIARGESISQNLSMEQTSGTVWITVSPDWTGDPSQSVAPDITVNR